MKKFQSLYMDICFLCGDTDDSKGVKLNVNEMAQFTIEQLEVIYKVATYAYLNGKFNPDA
jgi:hypothetical protein